MFWRVTNEIKKFETGFNKFEVNLSNVTINNILNCSFKNFQKIIPNISLTNCYFFIYLQFSCLFSVFFHIKQSWEMRFGWKFSKNKICQVSKVCSLFIHSLLFTWLLAYLIHEIRRAVRTLQQSSRQRTSLPIAREAPFQGNLQGSAGTGGVSQNTR